MEFAYDGGGLGKGGTVTLYIDGDQAGPGRVERTHAVVFSLVLQLAGVAITGRTQER